MAVTKYAVEPCASTSAPKKPAPLDEKEQVLYDKVLAHFAADTYTLPAAAGAGESRVLSAKEKMWLTKECLLRFLRASKWDADVAIKRLETTLRWRESYGIDSFVDAALVEPEGLTGKAVIFGYDVDARPSMYLLPSRQNTDVPDKQIQYTFWNLERVIDLMGPGVETLVLLIDFADKAKNPSISTARAVLNILQEHYPERLGKACVINIPYFITLFLKMVMPFVDPRTREKVQLNPTVVASGLYSPSQITTSWGGEVELPYEHEKYWPELVRLTSERRERERSKWEALGGKVGESEWDIKGGDVEGEKVPVQEEVKPDPEVAPVAISEKTTEPELETEPEPEPPVSEPLPHSGEITVSA